MNARYTRTVAMITFHHAVTRADLARKPSALTHATAEQIVYRRGRRMCAQPLLGWNRRRPAPVVHKKKVFGINHRLSDSLRLLPLGEKFPTPLNDSTVGLAWVVL